MIGDEKDPRLVEYSASNIDFSQDKCLKWKSFTAEDFGGAKHYLCLVYAQYLVLHGNVENGLLLTRVNKDVVESDAAESIEYMFFMKRGDGGIVQKTVTFLPKDFKKMLKNCDLRLKKNAKKS